MVSIGPTVYIRGVLSSCCLPGGVSILTFIGSILVLNLGDCEITIGNDPSSTICYNYPLISRQQARLVYNKGIWVIQDLNSKYGTYANNVSIF